MFIAAIVEDCYVDCPLSLLMAQHHWRYRFFRGTDDMYVFRRKNTATDWTVSNIELNGLRGSNTGSWIAQASSRLPAGNSSPALFLRSVCKKNKNFKFAFTAFRVRHFSSCLVLQVVILRRVMSLREEKKLLGFCFITLAFSILTAFCHLFLCSLLCLSTQEITVHRTLC